MSADQPKTAGEREPYWIFGRLEGGELWCSVMYSPSEDGIAEWLRMAGCHFQEAWMFRKSDGKCLLVRTDEEMDQIYERWGQGFRTSRERYLEEKLTDLVRSLGRLSLPEDEALSEALFNAKMAVTDNGGPGVPVTGDAQSRPKPDGWAFFDREAGMEVCPCALPGEPPIQVLVPFRSYLTGEQARRLGEAMIAAADGVAAAAGCD